MTAPADLLERLGALLGSVNLRLERHGDTVAIGYESETHPLTALPLDGVDGDAAQAELLSIAAGIDAAVKSPDELTQGEGLRDAAAPLLPKVERRRFQLAYDAVIDGRGHGPERRLYHRDFGADLVTAYVHDGGWRFTYLCQGRVRSWGASPDTIHSIARSNLYARHEVDHRASTVATADGYDAARAVIIDDVFFDRAGADGISIAIPSRDHLFIGPEIDADAVRAAYAAAEYPISPHRYWFKGHQLRRGGA